MLDLRTDAVSAPSLWEPFGRQWSAAPMLSVWDGGQFVDLDWDAWRSGALRAAGALRALGAGPGVRVACVLTNAPAVCSGALGVFLSGATLVSLPIPARAMGRARYFQHLRRLCGECGAEVLLAAGPFAELLSAAELGVRVCSFEALDSGTPAEPDFRDPAAELFIQYSSGSTREPKGCVLSTQAVASQLTLLVTALEIDPELTRGVSWMPLSHDMGFFGSLMVPYWAGSSLLLSSPERFMASPGSWFEDCARVQATISPSPNFALSLATRVAASSLSGSFPMRNLVVGSERVDLRTLQRAHAVLGDKRLPWRCFTPAYGLAEAVLAVSMTPTDVQPTVLHVDSRALAGGHVVVVDEDEDGASALVSAGVALPGSQLRIGGPHDVGEVCVRSSTLAEGYLGEPERTREAFVGGELHTGDLGFLLDGELFVTGRLDDMISIAGRNVYAHELEFELSRHPAIRRGNCAVVDVERGGRSQLVLVAELSSERRGGRALDRELSRMVLESAGIRLSRCLFLPRGKLPKTPSGKVQRYRCREIASDDFG